MSGEELKPADCPFCGAEMEPLNLGGSDHLSDFIHPGTVTDKQCLLSGQGFTGDQLAAWNRPHPLPEQPQEGVVKAIKEIERIALIARSDSAQRISPHWLASECNAILCAISKGATDD